MKFGSLVWLVILVILLTVPTSLYFDDLGPVLVAGVAAVIIYAAVTVSSGEDTDPDGSSWDAVPESDLMGKQAELGGLSKKEQNDSISDIQRQADSMEDENQ
ncbi:MAG: hypothetical protein ABEK59_05005 [Halobacteria archaeon]